VRGGSFGLGSVFIGFLAAGVSIAIVMGSILLAFSEAGQITSIDSYPTLESIDVVTPTIQPTAAPALVDAATPTSTKQATSTASRTPTLTSTGTSLAEETACNPPTGWIPYTVKPGDTLNKISAGAGIPPQDLADANCLVDSRLVPGSTLYLPPLEPTATGVSCGPPPGWEVYAVQPGDTLFNIAQRTNTSVYQLKYANCLTSDNIRVGQRFYVPYQPIPITSPTVPSATTQPPTATMIPAPTATPTDSNISKRTPPYPYPPP
jgi:LysM repeat protein